MKDVSKSKSGKPALSFWTDRSENWADVDVPFERRLLDDLLFAITYNWNFEDLADMGSQQNPDHSDAVEWCSMFVTEGFDPSRLDSMVITYYSRFRNALELRAKRTSESEPEAWLGDEYLETQSNGS